jgi:hypothetical protein
MTHPLPHPSPIGYGVIGRVPAGESASPVGPQPPRRATVRYVVAKSGACSDDAASVGSSPSSARRRGRPRMGSMRSPRELGPPGDARVARPEAPPQPPPPLTRPT